MSAREIRASKRTAAQRRATAKLLELALQGQASPPEPFSWASKLAMLLTIVRGDRMLVITTTALGPSGHVWTAMAVEGPSGTGGGSADEFLEDHAHDMISEGAPFSSVVRMCETFARGWIRKRERRDPCPCPPILTPKERAAGRKAAERGVATRRRRARGGK